MSFIPFRRLAGPSAALLLSAQTPALAGSGAAPVHFICSGAADPRECAALHHAIARQWPDREIRDTASPDTGLTLTYVPRALLSGHLSWRTATGGETRGPDLSVDVLDAAPGPDAFAQFARDILTITKIPF